MHESRTSGHEKGQAFRKLKEIRDQCKDAAPVKEQLDNVSEERERERERERDALILKAERNAAITGTIRRGRDALKLEVENFRGQYKKEVTLLVDESNSARTQL
jgi:hypothetical protein